MPNQLSRAERLAETLLRDGATCLWCGREFTRLVTATRDHLVPRVKGGPSWQENEAASCRRCNAARGHVSPAEWAAECERRGWPVDRARLTGSLLALQVAIRERGGQRRARAYVESQLRRLR